MQRINPDVVIALLLMVLCGVFFYETFALQKVYLAIIGSKLWPRVVVVVLFVLSVAYFLQSLRSAREPLPAPWRLGEWLRANRNVVGCFALYALFLLSLPYLGMLLGGMVFVFITLGFVGERSARHHLIHALIAVVSVGIVWTVFSYALGVVLPEGEILPRLLDAMGFYSAALIRLEAIA
jgi:putative tricarboxylic transport membrane protein